MNPCDLVRHTTKYVVEKSVYVKINETKIEETARKLSEELFNKKSVENHLSKDGYLPGIFIDWGGDTTEGKTMHFKENVKSPEETALYIFILTALNFCFWPIKDFEYRTLASRLKSCFKDDVTKKYFRVDKLSEMTEELLKSILFDGSKVDKIELPMFKERVRLLREVGTNLTKYFDGKIVNLIQRAGKSVTNLVELVTAFFPGFRDHSIYKGRQIFFLKRAQIFCGDLYGAFDGKGLGEFNDMDKLTMFPDYRLPQLFNEYGIMEYTKELSKKIRDKKLIIAGSEEEIEIRAASIQVVEKMRNVLEAKFKIKCRPQEIDWYYWEKAEKIKDSIVPNHQTLTIFY